MLIRTTLLFGLLLVQTAWYQGMLHVFTNPIRRFGASLLTTLASVMTLLVLLMFLTSKSLNQLQGMFITISCVASVVFLLRIRKDRKKRLQYRDVKAFIRQQNTHIAAITIPALTVLLFSIYVMHNNGDQGWDSNAYHLPISGILLYEGSSNFDPLLGLGTFTILTPYAAHALGALFSLLFGSFIFSSLITWIAILGFTCFAYGSVLEQKFNSNTNKLLLLLPSVVWLIPSVAGQTTHFYVDAFSGVFVASAFILLLSILKLENIPRFYFFLTGLMGSSAIGVKSQSIYPIGIILIIILAKTIQKKHFLNIALVTLPFFMLGLIPYLRNYLLFDNPIYPIQFMNFPGQISISELSASVESFVPKSWSENFFLRIAFSLLISPILVLCRVVASQIGWYDINRSDLVGFSYDSVIGGVGAPASLIFCIFLLYQIKNIQFNSTFGKISKKIVENRGSLTIPIAILFSCLFIPGSWWVRYNLGVVLFLVYLAFSFISSIRLRPSALAFFAVPLLTAIFLQSVLLGSYSLKYERNASKSTEINFEARFGLTQNPILRKSSCERLIFVEPRPTFTSAYWSLSCKKYFWTGNPLTYPFVDGDLVVMNSKMFFDFSSQFAGKYQSTPVNAWFDPKGDYGSYLVKIMGD